MQDPGYTSPNFPRKLHEETWAATAVIMIPICYTGIYHVVLSITDPATEVNIETDF